MRWLVVLVLVACGPRKVAPPPTPVAPDAGVAPIDAAVVPDAPRALADDLPTLASRSADLLDALAAALETQADCATLAAAARDVLASYLDVRTAQAAVQQRGAGRELDAALATYADRVVAAGARMRPAITACAADADFAAALTPVDVP